MSVDKVTSQDSITNVDKSSEQMSSQISVSYSDSSLQGLETTNPEIVITPYMGNVLSTIVEDAIDQLFILGAGMVPAQSLQIEDIEKRAAQYVSDDPLFDHETGDPFDEAFYKKKIMKLYFDSSKIAELLVQLRNELRYEKEFSCLTKFLQEAKSSQVDEVHLFSEESQNFDAMNNLKQTLLTQQRDSQDHMRSLNEEIAILKDHAEDVLFENLLRIRHISHWENARIEQNNLTCFEKETELIDTIAKYKNEIEKEIRVNNEIETFISENQTDMEEAIESWMERYDRDSESRTVEIAVLKEKREELSVEYNALKEVYDRHQQEIDDYLEYREKKRIEDERMEMLNKMATKIQAWWRGLLYRLQLGPYNPNKGKKGKKGKDKKGKDKKGKKK